MLLVLLTLTQIRAEWVEISQQHYRKPIRIHSLNNPFRNTDEIDVEDTTKSWTYNNKNNTEYNWTKATVNQPYKAEIKRIEPPSDRRTVIDRDKYRNSDEDVIELDAENETTTENSDIAKLKGIIERVPNKGNVKRVKLSNNAVKSPSMSIKTNKEQIRNDRYEEFPLDDDPKEFDSIKKMKNKINNRRIYFNNPHNSDIVNTFPTIEDITKYGEELNIIKKRRKQQYNNQTIGEDILSTAPTFISEIDDFKNYDALEKLHKFTPKKHTFTTETIDLYDDVNQNNKNIKQTLKEMRKNYTLANTMGRRKVITKDPVNNLSTTESDINLDRINNIEDLKPKKENGPEREIDIENVAEGGKITVEENNETEHKLFKETKPNNKVNNMDNLLKFLKVVADTISHNSHRSFGGKIKYLHELKNSILMNIADRIDTTWPDDIPAGTHRSSRSADSSRGHQVHVPSSESALMTISFLTFAVFLIKLVLQLIQTYKNKAMMVAPVVVTSAGRVARERFSRL